MNPVLLKPQSETGAQLVVQGRAIGTLRAGDFATKKATLLPAVLDSFERIAASADIVLVEGAGSPAEINLRAGDIANMGFAEAADVPVILAGDIDRGGVIASLIGTHTVLAEPERRRIGGFIVNKFRGDPRLFDAGVTAVVRATGWPCLGVLPWLPVAARLPAEDALDLDRGTPHGGRVKIAVPVLGRIANFDDLDPLGLEPEVELVFVQPGAALPGDAHVVILPGSKATIADLAFFHAQGWDIDLVAHRRRGGHVLGLCGGYQMLGRRIADPDGIEGPPGDVAGLGLLDVETIMDARKTTSEVTGLHLATGTSVAGYEIHIGRTAGADCARPILDLQGRRDGAASVDGRVQGCYVHGIFASDTFRHAWLAGFGAASHVAYEAEIEAALDALADHIEAHLDVDAIIAIAQSRQMATASAI